MRLVANQPGPRRRHRSGTPGEGPVTGRVGGAGRRGTPLAVGGGGRQAHRGDRAHPAWSSVRWTWQSPCCPPPSRATVAASTSTPFWPTSSTDARRRPRRSPRGPPGRSDRARREGCAAIPVRRHRRRADAVVGVDAAGRSGAMVTLASRPGCGVSSPTMPTCWRTGGAVSGYRSPRRTRCSQRPWAGTAPVPCSSARPASCVNCSAGAARWRSSARRRWRSRLRALRADAASWLGPDFSGRFSLAGAQAKTALYLSGGSWGVPAGTAATSHILKPPPAGFHRLDLNEHLCLRAAAHAGLHAARSRIMMFEDETAIVVERFDRVRAGDGLNPRSHGGPVPGPRRASGSQVPVRRRAVARGDRGAAPRQRCRPGRGDRRVAVRGRSGLQLAHRRHRRPRQELHASCSPEPVSGSRRSTTWRRCFPTTTARPTGSPWP